MEGILPTQWIELFKGLDLAALAMLSVIAFALEKSERISVQQTVLVLLVGGALFGLVQGFATYGAETPIGVLIGFIAKGVLMNSGGAYLIAIGVRAALEKYNGATS